MEHLLIDATLSIPSKHSVLIDPAAIEQTYTDLNAHDNRPSPLPTTHTLRVVLDERTYNAHASFLVRSKKYADVIQLICANDSALEPLYYVMALTRKTADTSWQLAPTVVIRTGEKDWKSWCDMNDRDRMKELKLD